MFNIKTSVKGKTLTVEIDLNEKGRPSASGKTQIIASTEGNAAVDGSDVTIGVNAWRKPKK